VNLSELGGQPLILDENPLADVMGTSAFWRGQAQPEAVPRSHQCINDG
jgi:hypothetical protein